MFLSTFLSFFTQQSKGQQLFFTKIPSSFYSESIFGKKLLHLQSNALFAISCCCCWSYNFILNEIQQCFDIRFINFKSVLAVNQFRFNWKWVLLDFDQISVVTHDSSHCSLDENAPCFSTESNSFQIAANVGEKESVTISSSSELVNKETVKDFTQVTTSRSGLLSNSTNKQIDVTWTMVDLLQFVPYVQWNVPK